MSTDYGLRLTASDGSVSDITIIDSFNPLPGSDTWLAAEPADWDTKGGQVSSWGSGGVWLSAPIGAQAIRLDRFGKNTVVGDAGEGSKNYEDGSFPSGPFRWECTSKI